jgi:hypothetical protein
LDGVGTGWTTVVSVFRSQALKPVARRMAIKARLDFFIAVSFLQFGLQ